MTLVAADDRERGQIVLERGTIEGVDFHKAAFEQITPTACLFVDCDFSGLVFDARYAALFGSRMQSVFRSCRFDGADLRKSGPGQSRFEGCSFDEAMLDGWTSLAGEFIDCTFSGTIRKAKFHGRPHGALASALAPARTQNEFRGNDLSRVRLVDTSFVHGIAFDGQRWPEGGEERLDHIQQRLERARLEVMRQSAEARAPAVALLMHLGSVYGEQRELLRAQYDGSTSTVPPELRSSVWALLTRTP
ncbi:MAG TPA: hypothetical protein VFM93_03100 [Candidatus Limnocylindria bacterium]|nr:hypothetical protein [Candidatus Limnocylindria bacterium]